LYHEAVRRGKVIREVFAYFPPNFNTFLIRRSEHPQMRTAFAEPAPPNTGERYVKDIAPNSPQRGETFKASLPLGRIL
jgi:hypothetical protein